MLVAVVAVHILVKPIGEVSRSVGVGSECGPCVTSDLHRPFDDLGVEL